MRAEKIGSTNVVRECKSMVNDDKNRFVRSTQVQGNHDWGHTRGVGSSSHTKEQTTVLGRLTFDSGDDGNQLER